MNGNLGLLILLTMLIGCLTWANSQAAPRHAEAAVLKLQSMVKTLSSERDAAIMEAAKLQAEIERLKKLNSAAATAKEQVETELTAQKHSKAELLDKLDKTQAKLLDANNKNQEISQAKNKLNNELTALNTKQQATGQLLEICGAHNLKLYQSAKELLYRYQHKGALESLLQNDEPLLRLKSVEMENIVQDYEDKLNANKLEDKQAP